ncbi:DUF6907 domain-containing protein [Streptomyces sp. NPDC055025]
MNAPRTVTIETLDRGDVTIPEPAWCVGHDGDPPQFLSDTNHTGPAHEATYLGHHLGYAALVENPLVVQSNGALRVVVEIGGALGIGLNPEELDGLAAVLVDYAGELRGLARQLTVLLAEGDR